MNKAIIISIFILLGITVVSFYFLTDNKNQDLIPDSIEEFIGSNNLIDSNNIEDYPENDKRIIKSEGGSGGGSSSIKQAIIFNGEEQSYSTKGKITYEIDSITGIEYENYNAVINNNQLILTAKPNKDLPSSINVRKSNNKNTLDNSNPSKVNKGLFSNEIIIELDGVTTYYKIGDNSIFITSRPYNQISSSNITFNQGDLNQDGNFHLNLTTNISKVNITQVCDGYGCWNETKYTKGIVAYYGFDELDYRNLTIWDYTELSNDGVYGSGSYPNRTFGIYGGSAFFNGTQDPITFGATEQIAINDSFVLMAWIYPSEFANETIISRTNPGDFPDYSFSFGEGGVNKITFEYRTSSGTIQTLSSYTGLLNLSMWNHIAVVREANNVHFYHNGKLNRTVGSPGDVKQTNGATVIGAKLVSGAFRHKYSGYMDEFMMFQGSLNSSDINMTVHNRTIWNYNITKSFYDKGEVKFNSLNFTGFDYVHINLTRYANNFSSFISMKISNGTEINFTSGRVINYDVRGIAQKGSANFSIYLYSGNQTGARANNTFITPMVIGNITFDLFNDSVFDFINITYPLNNSVFSNPNITINYSVNDIHLQSCWYTNNSGVTNNSITCNQNISATWLVGINNITIYANDSLGNVGSSSVRFNVTLPIPNSIQLIGFNITGIQANRGARLFIQTNNNSKSDFDLRDTQTTSGASNYTTFYSRICASGGTCTLQLNSLNVTDLPLTFNLTYFSNPSMLVNSLLVLNWSWNQSNINATLTDYGISSDYVSNYSSPMDMRLLTSYQVTLNSSRTNNYFKLEVNPV